MIKLRELLFFWVKGLLITYCMFICLISNFIVTQQGEQFNAAPWLFPSLPVVPSPACAP